MWKIKTLTQSLTLFLLSSSLMGCAAEGMINLGAFKIPESANLSSVITQASQFTRQRVRVVFYSQLSNQELVPLSPEKLLSLEFNNLFEIPSSSYDQNQGLEQVFPFIEAGNHQLSLNFVDIEDKVIVPLEVPKSEREELTIMVVIAFQNNLIKSVEVGQDRDLNQKIDVTSRRFVSSNGQDFELIEPDGTRRNWVSPLNTETQERDPEAEAPITPGFEPDPDASTEPPPTREGAEPINSGDPGPTIEAPPIPQPLPPELPTI